MRIDEHLNIIISKCTKLTNQQIGQQSSRLPAAQALQKKTRSFFSEAVLTHVGVLPQ